MNVETELRSKLTKIYVLISGDEATPDRMSAASEKLSEAISILSGTFPVPVEEKSHG